MTVTRIEEHTKSKYKIYLNDEFAFVLYKGELRQYKIKEGDVLPDETYQEIIEVVLTKRAKLRTMHLLQSIDRTEADVRRKLKEGLYPESVIDSAIAYVKSYHYIDDARYAGNYIDYRLGSMSRSELKQKLLQKGIDKDIIEEQLNERMEAGDEQEKELLRRLMLKKIKEPRVLGYQEKNKLFSYLYRKGFSLGDIERVYQELLLDIT